MPGKIDSMKVDVLKLKLEKRNLSKTGNKVDLQNRLKDWATSNDRDDILNKLEYQMKSKMKAAQIQR